MKRNFGRTLVFFILILLSFQLIAFANEDLLSSEKTLTDKTDEVLSILKGKSSNIGNSMECDIASVKSITVDGDWELTEGSITASQINGSDRVVTGILWQTGGQLIALGGRNDNSYGVSVEFGVGQINGEIRASGGTGGDSYGLKVMGSFVQDLGTLVAVSGEGKNAYGAYLGSFFQLSGGLLLAAGSPNAAGVYIVEIKAEEKDVYGAGEVQASGILILDNYYKGTAIYSEGIMNLNQYVWVVPAISIDKIEENSPALLYSVGLATIKKGHHPEKNDETALIPLIYNSYLLEKGENKSVLLLESESEIKTELTIVQINSGNKTIFDILNNTITLSYSFKIDTEVIGSKEKIKRLHLIITRDKTPAEALSGYISDNLLLFLDKVYDLAGSHEEFSELISDLDNYTTVKNAVDYIIPLEYNLSVPALFTWKKIADREMTSNKNFLNYKLSSSFDENNFSLWLRPSSSAGTIENEYYDDLESKEIIFEIGLGAAYKINKFAVGIQLSGSFGTAANEYFPSTGKGFSALMGAKFEIPLNRFLNPYVVADIGYSFKHLEMQRKEIVSSKWIDSSTNQNVIYTEIALGNKFIFSDKFDLSLQVGANYLNIKSDGYKEDTSSAFRMNVGEMNSSFVSLVVGTTANLKLFNWLDLYANALYTIGISAQNSDLQVTYDSISDFELTSQNDIGNKNNLDLNVGMIFNISSGVSLSLDYTFYNQYLYSNHKIGINLGIKI